jgi:hypothetical protein
VLHDGYLRCASPPPPLPSCIPHLTTFPSPDYTPWGKLWIFIGFQYFIFSFMGLFAYLVDDIPEEVCVADSLTHSPSPVQVIIQQSRQDFHREKVAQV